MKLIIQTMREEYSKDSVKQGMTVGDLMNYLQWYDADTEIILSFDSGYTYGAIREERINEDWEDERGEE